MANPDNKNATIEYTKFVQSSRHSEMKAIFDTFIPFILFKECLDKKEKDEQGKLLEEKKKKEGVEGDKILVNDLQKELQMNKSINNRNKKEHNDKFESEEVEEDSEKSEDPFDLTKDYDKVFNFNLITDEEKDEFRKGKPLPYLKNNLLNIISKKFSGTVPPPLPRQEQYHFQLISFRFKDVSLMRCPKICFKQNVSLFDNIPDPQSIKPPFFNINNTDENSINSSNKNLIHTSNKNLIKTTTIINNNQNQKPYNKKNFLKYKSLQNNKSEMMNSDSSNSSDEDNKFKDKNIGKEDESSSNNVDRNSLARDSLLEGNTLKNKEKPKNDLMIRNSTNIKNYNGRPSKIIPSEIQLKPYFFFKTENGKANKFIKFNKAFINYDSVIKTLSAYSIDENFPESKNKIAIPSDNLRQEIFIFDPINIDLNKGALNSFIFEEILKKRAKLLFPYRQNFIKIIIIKLLQFLFIIKSKIANKKNMKNSNQLTNYKKKNGKTKLKEIEGSNIITFSDVKPFMKSKFGHFNMDVFKKAYEKKLQKNDEMKRQKKMAELQRKFLDILQKDDIEHQANDDDDNLKNEKRRNDANPQDIEKDSKMLLGAVYKPRKKMNYLNGLKMLIKEEATKNKGSNFKYQ